MQANRFIPRLSYEYSCLLNDCVILVVLHVMPMHYNNKDDAIKG